MTKNALYQKLILYIFAGDVCRERLLIASKSSFLALMVLPKGRDTFRVLGKWEVGIMNKTH